MPGRPKPLEPRRSSDEYIDDLPTQQYPWEQDASNGHADPNVDTVRIKRVAIRPGTVLGLVLLVAFYACGWATAAMQYVTSNRDDIQADKPDPAPTVTVTETVTELPASCQRALRDMAKYLDAAAAVSAAGGQQSDILDRAYQAIMQRDWQELNRLREDQHKLESSMLPASSVVIPQLRQVQKELAQCQSDAE